MSFAMDEQKANDDLSPAEARGRAIMTAWSCRGTAVDRRARAIPEQTELTPDPAPSRAKEIVVPRTEPLTPGPVAGALTPMRDEVPAAGTTTVIAKATPAAKLPLFADERAQARIAPFLPEGVSYERVVAAAQLAIRDNPAIAKCTPESIVTSVARAAQSNLEIGIGCHLVPYGDKCTFIPDYKGIAQIMIAAKVVRSVEADCVYEGEEFEMQRGTESFLRHVPLSRGSERGKMIGAYCILRLPFSQSEFVYAPIEDIDAVRREKSKQWKTGDCPPWWAKKYVVKQAAKLKPTPQLMRLLAAIADDEDPDAPLSPSSAIAAPARGDDDAPVAPQTPPTAEAA